MSAILYYLKIEVYANVASKLSE